MHISNLATMRAMERAYVTRNSRALDLVASGAIKVEGELKLKRIQFDAFFELYDRLVKIAGLLEVTQREFLETALVDALNAAEATYAKTFADLTGEEVGEGA